MNTDSMLSLFKQKTGRFTPLETATLVSYEAAMPPEWRATMKLQIESIDRAERYPPSTWVEVDFFPSREPLSGTLRPFPNKTLNLKLATLTFQFDGDTKVRQVYMHLVQGFFFSLVFRPAEKLVSKRTDIAISSVVFHDDPMRPCSSLNVFFGTYRPVPDTDWIERLKSKYVQPNVLGAKTPDDVNLLLSRFSIALPDDYVDVLRVCDGFSAGKVTVLGAGDLHKSPQDPGDIVVLATYPGGFIGIREGDISGELFYCSNDGKAPVSAGVSFRSALESWMQVHA